MSWRLLQILRAPNTRRYSNCSPATRPWTILPGSQNAPRLPVAGNSTIQGESHRRVAGLRRPALLLAGLFPVIKSNSRRSDFQNMKQLIICLIGLTTLSGSVMRAQTLSMAGHWRFQLDRADVGIHEHWFAHKLSDTIRLPGSLPEQGIGDDISTNTSWTGSIVDRSWFT